MFKNILKLVVAFRSPFGRTQLWQSAAKHCGKRGAGHAGRAADCRWWGLVNGTGNTRRKQERLKHPWFNSALTVHKEIPSEWQSECQILNQVSNFEQRFLRDEKVSAKTLDTSMQHTSENPKSGRILDNSENSLRYLSFCEICRGGVPPGRSGHH